MKCPACGKDIPERYFDEPNNEIPKPCDECLAETKQKIDSYPKRNEGKNKPKVEP